MSRSFSISHITFVICHCCATLLILVGVFYSTACQAKSDQVKVIREYALRGRVESLDLDRQKVTIAHETIEGYMEAMTMSFAVKDSEVLRQLKSGDRVEAKLFFDSGTNLSWLENIKVLRKPE